MIECERCRLWVETIAPAAGYELAPWQIAMLHLALKHDGPTS